MLRGISGLSLLLLPDLPGLPMGLTLNEIVPWGRSYDEYVAMFGLTESDRQSRILGCGDGPAAFNAESRFCLSDHV